MSSPTTLALVEDNAGVRRSLTQLFAGNADFTCVGACSNGQQALRQIPLWKPQVVLMDIELPDVSGIECTARLKRERPELQILILTVYQDNEQIFRALEAGASGYLLKRSSPDEILRALADLRDGGAPMSAEIARRVVQHFHRAAAPAPAPSPTIASLTKREAEILAALAQGFASKEIADRLGISYETVCGHLGNIYGKLHVHSRTEAVIKYFQRG